MPVFEQRCAQCHGANATERRAPDRRMLAELTPERILDALTTGSMVPNATGLSDTQKRYLAEFLSGRPLGSSKAGQAAAMPNRCEAKPIGNLLAGPSWIGWGNDATNGRMQTAAAAGLTPAQVPKLTLKWAFGFPKIGRASCRESGSLWVGRSAHKRELARSVCRQGDDE